MRLGHGSENVTVLWIVKVSPEEQARALYRLLRAPEQLGVKMYLTGGQQRALRRRAEASAAAAEAAAARAAADQAAADWATADQ